MILACKQKNKMSSHSTSNDSTGNNNNSNTNNGKGKKSTDVGKVYQLWSNKLRGEDGEVLYYVGSTMQKLNTRLNKQRANFKEWQNGKRKEYITCFRIHEVDKAPNIETIEELDNPSKDELRYRESFYIREYGTKCINMIDAHLTEEERVEKKREWMRQWYNKNREHRQQKDRQWRENNKEHERQRKSEREQCKICNVDIRRSDMAKHKRSQRHINNLNNQN